MKIADAFVDPNIHPNNERRRERGMAARGLELTAVLLQHRRRVEGVLRARIVRVEHDHRHVDVGRRPVDRR
jgi:hypothetical protein